MKHSKLIKQNLCETVFFLSLKKHGNFFWTPERKETLVNAMRVGLSLRSRTNGFCRNHGPISGVSGHNSDARRANFTGEVVA